MSPDEARRVARLRLGNAPLIREDARAVWGWRWMDATAKDVRYAWRSLRRTPGFSAVVILTMGLGVGAVTAVYSIVDPLLLRPLPFREPTSLYKVLTVGRDGGYGAFVARDLARALRDQPQIFTSVGAFREESWTHDQPEPSLVEGAWVTPGLFPSLGVAPRLGRLFDREEWTADVALISARLWRVRFGARDDMLGQRLRLQHGTFTVVGVLPGDVRFPSPESTCGFPSTCRAQRDRDELVSWLASETTCRSTRATNAYGRSLPRSWFARTGTSNYKVFIGRAVGMSPRCRGSRDAAPRFCSSSAPSR